MPKTQNPLLQFKFLSTPKDVLALATIQDPRAGLLLRRGLDSPYPLVVSLSVQGLGRLQDIGAIPMIAKACDRFPASAQQAIAMNLPWYSGGEANELIQRLVPDRRARDLNFQNVQSLRQIELKRIASRISPALK